MDKVFGGSSYDYCNDAIATNDGGYLLVGASSSPIGGDKSEGSRGDDDYWAVRIDADGHKVWDKTFGGSARDTASAVVATSDGGYLLVGHSTSDKDGDKSEGYRGGEVDRFENLPADYWVVKIDADGIK